MLIPQLLSDLASVLLLLAPSAALISLVLAGVSLRREAVMIFDIRSGFTRWMFWAILFITLQPLLNWFASFGIAIPGSSGAIAASWLSTFQADVSQFIAAFVLQRMVPTLAAFFVLRGVLDTASGRHSLPSILTTMFLLSVQTTYTLLQSYSSGTRFATIDVLDSLWNHIVGTVMPIAAVLSLIGAVLNFATRRPFVRLVAVSLAMLTISAIWKLITSMM
jgi:hypothetical protein